MSLTGTAAQVTVGDLLNLQQGIEFFTNVPEATLETALINAGTTTVSAYANQLILNNLVLSQVTMGVDSLMNGAVDTEAGMTFLTTQFLPAQLAYFHTFPASSQATFGPNPTAADTEWDAAVLGFTLGNNAHFNTAFVALNSGANAGATGNAAFAQAVSIAVFGNTSLTSTVLAFLNNNIAFLNNPNAQAQLLAPAHLTLLQGADGLTFGEMIGLALANPSTVGAFLDPLVANALIDNAEFLNGQLSSPVGIALGLLPPHIPLQGEAQVTLTLTVGTDNATTGAHFIANGVDTGITVPASGVVISAPLGGIFGNQATLTPGDIINLFGTGNTLNANFNTGGTFTVAGETIKGAQAWNISNFGTGTVNINGGANVGGSGGGTNPGVQTLTYLNSGGGSVLNVGGPGTGIQSVLTNISLLNNGTDETVSVYESAAAFAAAGAPTAITVTVNDGATGFPIVDAGPDAGTTGYKTFNVVSQGGASVNNGIELGATLATNATAVTLADDGATTTLFASDNNSSTVFNWANLTSIAAVAGAATGVETISGHEEGGTFGFLDVLTGSAAHHFSVSLDNASGNFVDLSSWTATAANLSIALGTGTGNEVDLNSALVDTTTAFAVFTGVAIVGDVETAGGALGGTINMNNFPLASEILLKAADGDADPVQSASFTVNNAPTTFTFNYQNDAMGGFNTQISSGGSTTATLTVDAGAVTGSTGSFAAGGYHTVNLNETSSVSLFGTSFLVQSVFGDTPTLNLNHGTHALTLADGTAVTPLTVGLDTLTVLGGTILLPTDGNISDNSSTGGLTIGVTNAISLFDTSTGALIMDGPEDTFHYAGSVIGDFVAASGALSVLQGSMGTLTSFSSGGTSLSWHGATSGFNAAATQDILTDLAGHSAFFGDGGGDLINLGGGGNAVWFGAFWTAGTFHTQGVVGDAATNDDANPGFWGLGAVGANPADVPITAASTTSLDMTTISGFNVTGGAGVHDTLEINVSAWNGGIFFPPFNGVGELSQFNAAAGMSFAAPGSSTIQLITTQLQHLGDATASVVAYGLGNIGSASGLVTALNSAAGALTVDATSPIATNTHVLFAYASTGGDIKIADVDFLSGVGGGATTQLATIAASDMFDIGHSSDLLGLSIHPADIAFFNING